MTALLVGLVLKQENRYDQFLWSATLTQHQPHTTSCFSFLLALGSKNRNTTCEKGHKRIGSTTMATTSTNSNKRTAERSEEHTRRKSLKSEELESIVEYSTPRQVYCVAFDLEPCVALIPSRLEYSEEEVEDMWYSALEKQAMIHGALKSASAMNPDDSMARGLEALTCAGSMSRQAHRRRTLSAVLREQERQKRFHGDSIPPNSDELLSHAVGHISRRCQEMANERAYQDEIEVFPELKLATIAPEDSADREATMLTQTLRVFSFGWLTTDPQ